MPLLDDVNGSDPDLRLRIPASQKRSRSLEEVISKLHTLIHKKIKYTKEISLDE